MQGRDSKCHCNDQVQHKPGWWCFPKCEKRQTSCIRIFISSCVQNPQVATERIRPDAITVCMPAQGVAKATLQAIEAEVPLICGVAEHILVHDTSRVQEAFRAQSRSRLVGTNCPNIVPSLHACRFAICRCQHAPCIAGIASDSETASHEAVDSTTKAGLVTTLYGCTWRSVASHCSCWGCCSIDPDTKDTVLLGEVKAALKDHHHQEIEARSTPKPACSLAGQHQKAERQVILEQYQVAAVPVPRTKSKL